MKDYDNLYNLLSIENNKDKKYYVFIRLYDKELIYRGDRIINWCPSCKTAISDAEVEHEDFAGYIWHIRYPIKTIMYLLDYMIVFIKTNFLQEQYWIKE